MNLSLRIVALLALALLLATPARAQFNAVPEPQLKGPPAPANPRDEADYKKAMARHLYSAYGSRIYKGKLPPLLYGIMLTETHVDDQGAVIDVRVIRPPAAPEVAPWVLQMIKTASPFPAPGRLGKAAIVEIWLVDKSGRFQLDTLTEGQL